MIPFIDAQTEALFFAALNELKEKIALLANKNQLVGQYWNQTDTRAPFEEELTLSQLASLDPQTLLKKKSINQEKVLALTNAVKTAIDRGRLSIIKNTDTPITSITVKQLASKIITSIKDEKEPDDNDTTIIFGIFSAASLLSNKHDFVGLLENILFDIGSKNFVKVFDGKLSKKQNQLILDKIDQSVAAILPEVHLHWRTALSGAGASLRTLLSPYLSSNFDDPENLFVLPVIKTLLYGIKATEVKISKTILSDHFTLTPDVAPKLYKALKPKRNFTSKDDVSDHLGSAFPFFDLDSLYNTLK